MHIYNTYSHIYSHTYSHIIYTYIHTYYSQQKRMAPEYNELMVPPANIYGKKAAYCIECGHQSIVMEESELDRSRRQNELDSKHSADMKAYDKQTKTSKRAVGKGAPRKQSLPTVLFCCCSQANCYQQVVGIFDLKIYLLYSSV